VTSEILLGIAYGAIGFYVIAHPLAGLAMHASDYSRA
jgi:hypothetical protein